MRMVLWWRTMRRSWQQLWCVHCDDHHVRLVVGGLKTRWMHCEKPHGWEVVLHVCCHCGRVRWG